MRDCGREAIALCMVAAVLGGCGRGTPAPPARPTPDVTTVVAAPRDVPVTFEFVAQTQSSQAVNIQARVTGFLDKRVYTEGAVVKAGQVLFQMDQKPFQAQVDAAQAALQRTCRRRCEVAKANLERTKPLAEQNALSQKDLDDAQRAVRAVAGGRRRRRRRQLESAQLNLSYTTITSPVDGVTSYARRRRRHVRQPAKQPAHDGLGADADVDQLQHLRERDAAHPQRGRSSGLLKLPDGNSSSSRSRWSTATLFPYTGKITFADPVVQLARPARSCARARSTIRRVCCARTSTCARG